MHYNDVCYILIYLYQMLCVMHKSPENFSYVVTRTLNWFCLFLRCVSKARQLLHYMVALILGALSDDAVWHLSVWCLAACAAGRLDGAYWLIGPVSAGLAQGCRCTLPLQAWAGAYHGGRPPTACWCIWWLWYIAYIVNNACGCCR